MVGVKGRSGRITSEAQRENKRRAGRLGAVKANATRARKADPALLIGHLFEQGKEEAIRENAVEPTAIADLLKLKQIGLTEEKKRTAVVERQILQKKRPPIALFEEYAGTLVTIMVKALDTAPLCIELSVEFDEAQVAAARAKIRAWALQTRTNLEAVDLLGPDHAQVRPPEASAAAAAAPIPTDPATAAAHPEPPAGRPAFTTNAFGIPIPISVPPVSGGGGPPSAGVRTGRASAAGAAGVPEDLVAAEDQVPDPEA
jgi:hypothetical protein